MPLSVDAMNISPQELQSKWRANPLQFSKDFFNSTLWEKQEEIMLSVRDNPRTTVRSCNSGGKSRVAAEIILWFLLSHYPSKVIITAPCYDDKTEILTNRGWILFKNLQPIDLVAQYNAKGEAEFTSIKGYVRFPYKGEMIGFKSPLYDFLVTPEHKCLFLNTNGKLKEDLAKNIYGRVSLKFPRIFKYPETKSDLSLDFCEFLGFWFAEGCSQYDEEKRKYRITITQKTKIKYTEDLLNRTGLKYHKYAKKNYPNSPWQGGYNYEIYNKSLAKWFEQFQKGARNKKLTNFILTFDKSRAERFLTGYIAGDGNIDKNKSIRMSTSSKELADGLQLLCNKVGWISNIGVQKGNGKYKSTYYLGAWVNRGKYVQTKKEYWHKQDYDGFVYCVKVPSGFVITRRNDKIAISGNTFLQVEKILWKEIATLYHKSVVPIGGDLLATELKLNDEWFALGISTDEVNRFQGFKSPYLLIVMDEALGISPIIWEAAEGLLPYRILAMANPLAPEGEFFKTFSSPLWHKISISAKEAIEWQNKNGVIPGLVNQQWVDERRSEWGEKSPLWQSRVLGEFPQEGTDTLVHLNWMDFCRTNILDEEDDALSITACDVARYGEDKTVFIDRKGHTFELVEIKEKIPTTQTAGIVKRHYQDKLSDALVVDDTGIGGGVSDILSEQKIGVYAFNGGCKAQSMDTVHFKNLRSQFYWITARKIEKGLYSFAKLPAHIFEKLKSEICSIRYVVESDGKIKIESKDDMKARGLHSPDIADCVMMSEYGYYMGRVGEIASRAWC